MKFARYVFAIAAVYGVLVLLPLYFLLDKTGIDNPPAVTHPEFYYGFVGVAIAFQIVFFIIASDPSRYRPLMIPSIAEKISFGIPTLFLYAQGRVAGTIILGALMDLVLALLFAIAYLETRGYRN